MTEKVRFKVIASGSNGNAAYLSTPDGTLLIDAGISRTRILNAVQEDGIEPTDIKGILITHAHTDHSSGLAVLSDYVEAPLYLTKGTKKELARLGTRDPRFYEASEYSYLLDFKHPFLTDHFDILPLETQHDAEDSCGFQITYNDTTISILTDLGDFEAKHIDALRESDIALVEMNHNTDLLKVSNRPYWLKKRIKRAHLSNNQTISLINNIFEKDNKLKAVIMGHLSGECNNPDLVASTISAWQYSREKACQWYIAQRDRSTGIIELQDDILFTKMQPIEIKNRFLAKKIRNDIKNLGNFF